MGKLVIVGGVSGCGKTTLRNDLIKAGTLGMAEKYSTRKYRGEGDDIIHVDKMDDAPVDLTYNRNGHDYGINLEKISNDLQTGGNLGIIISDVDVIRQIRKRLGEQVEAYYISAPVDSARLLQIHIQRNLGALTNKQQSEIVRLMTDAVKKRVEELAQDPLEETRAYIDSVLPEYTEREKNISLLYQDYISDMGLFDNVILNYGTTEDMLNQANTLIGNAMNRDKSRPTIFMLMAASGAGKGTLLQRISQIRLPNTSVVDKMAQRERKPKDEIDRIIPIGRDGVFPEEFDWRWVFHKGENFDGIGYAVNSSQMKQDLSAGKNLILISNIGQIGEAMDLFGNSHVVPIYMHAVRTKEEMEAYQTSSTSNLDELMARLGETSTVFHDYLANRGQISHVILNTTNPEDLFRQFQNIYAHYTQIKGINFDDGEPGERD